MHLLWELYVMRKVPAVTWLSCRAEVTNDSEAVKTWARKQTLLWVYVVTTT